MFGQESTVPVFFDNMTDTNLTGLIENFKKNWPVREWVDRGYFSEEYISDINAHWLKYPPPETKNFYIIGIMYFIITMFGVVGNILVVFLFIR